MDIVIITKLVADKFFGLLNSIKKFTDMSRFNFLVCYTGDNEEEEERIKDSLKDYNHKIIRRDYNFSKNCNELVKLGTSDKILILNDDIELVSDSISYMEKVLDSSYDIGMVGMKLLFPDGRIQHFGQFVVLDENDEFGGVGHLGFKCKNQETPDIFAQGVTSAMVMMRRRDFESIGGYNENYDRAFQDVELCWEVRKMDKKIVCVGKECAIHHESVTRGKDDLTRKDVNIMKDFWNSNKKSLIKDEKIYINTIIRRKKQMKTAIISIMADYERPYLKEWIEYNKIIGFDDIYIYENNCDFSDMNLPYYVHLIKYPGISLQLKAYNDWIKNYSKYYDWGAFIDTDEFIVLKKHDCIKNFLSAYNGVPALGLNWVLFGSKEVESLKGTNKVIERFVNCQRGVNKHVKTIVNFGLHRQNNSDVKFLSDPHHTNSIMFSPDDLTRYFVSPFSPLGKRDTAYIAHYCTKTKEECMERRSKPRADCGITRANIEQFFQEHDKNEELNYDVCRIYHFNGQHFENDKDIEILR